MQFCSAFIETLLFSFEAIHHEYQWMYVQKFTSNSACSVPILPLCFEVPCCGFFSQATYYQGSRGFHSVSVPSEQNVFLVKYGSTCAFLICKSGKEVRQCWHTPLIPAIGRQRQADLCEFKVSLVYKAYSRTARNVTQRNPISKNSWNKN